jgi:hypothetical protein
MKTTIPGIRKIIREELRRVILSQAKAALLECIDKSVLREWNELQKQQQVRRQGVGPYVSTPKTGTQENPSDLMQASLRLLDRAEKDERVSIDDVLTQLNSVYAALKRSQNKTQSTAWLAGVMQAINLVKQLKSSQVDPRQRKVRLQKAQSSIMNLGKGVEID